MTIYYQQTTIAGIRE